MHLINYENIEKAIEQERKAFIKVQAFSDDTDVVRSADEAKVVLGFLKNIHEALSELFEKFSSLEEVFDKEFVNFKDFTSLEYILETCC